MQIAKVKMRQRVASDEFTAKITLEPGLHAGPATLKITPHDRSEDRFINLYMSSDALRNLKDALERHFAHADEGRKE